MVLNHERLLRVIAKIGANVKETVVGYIAADPGRLELPCVISFFRTDLKGEVRFRFNVSVRVNRK